MPTIGDLEFMRLLEKRQSLKTTVLHRPGGVWHNQEVSLLVSGLVTEVSQLKRCPEYLIIWGHYTKEQTLAAIGGGVAYTATQMNGVDSLPFNPGWTV